VDQAGLSLNVRGPKRAGPNKFWWLMGRAKPKNQRAGRGLGWLVGSDLTALLAQKGYKVQGSNLHQQRITQVK